MLDISHVAPDPTALAHADDCRLDNATGTDGGLPAQRVSGAFLRLTGRDPMLRGSAAMTKGQLLKQLDRWGIKYVEVSRGGVPWYDHHRPASTGAYGSMHGTLNHHTGPYGTVKGMLAMLWDGRSDLPGPLCQVSTGPDGTLYLIGWNGRANHAGLGASNVYKALLADKAPPKPGSDSVDGNAILYGNEVMHPGSSKPYPDAQIETVVRWNAAILEWHKWQAASAIQHKEWTARKVDMSWHGANAGHDLRAEIARALEEGPAKYAFPADKPAPKPKPKPKPKTAVITTTIAALAALLGVTVAAILGVNPGLPDNPAPGTTVTVPVPTPTPTPKPAKPPAKRATGLRVNDTGAAVKKYEGCLATRGLLGRAFVDTYYGTTTSDATKRLKANHRKKFTSTSGVAGPTAVAVACAKPKKPKTSKKALRYGDTSKYVRIYEGCLADRGRLSRKWVDTYYGTETVKGTNQLIRNHHKKLAPADGVAGPLTQQVACS